MGGISCTQFTHRLLFPDLLAGDIKLNIEGKKSVKTLFGSLLTLFFLFCMAAAISFSLYGYFRTDNPSSFTELFQQSDYPKIDLTQNSLAPVFFAYLGDTELIEATQMSKYISFEVTRQTWTSTPQASWKVDTKVEETYFDTVPCGTLSPAEMNTYSYIKDGYLRAIILKYGFCVKLTKEFYSSGRIADNQYEMIAYKLKPCSLANPAECASADDVSSINYFLVMPETNLDQNDFNNPYQQAPNMDLFYYITPSMAQVITSHVKTNTIYDYLGVLPTWNPRQSYHDVKDSSLTLIARSGVVTCEPTSIGKAGNPPDPDKSCESYSEFWIMSSGAVLTVRRKYKTLVETFGEIGGVKTVLAFLLFIVYFQYNGYAQKRAILQMMYPELTSEQSYLKHLNGLPTTTALQPSVKILSKSDAQNIQPGSTKLEILEPSQTSVSRSKDINEIPPAQFHQQYEDVKQTLIKQMMMNLDVSEISKELQILRFLSSLLLTPEHLDKTRQLSLLEAELICSSGSPQKTEQVAPPNLVASLRAAIDEYLDHKVLLMTSKIKKSDVPKASSEQGRSNLKLNSVKAAESVESSHRKQESPRGKGFDRTYSSLVNPEVVANSPASRPDSHRMSPSGTNSRLAKMPAHSNKVSRTQVQIELPQGGVPGIRAQSPVFKEQPIPETSEQWTDSPSNPILAASKRISRFNKTAVVKPGGTRP